METRIACATCGLAQSVEELRPGTAAECCRCGAILDERKVDSLGRTAALSLAALIFYVPANIYPILRMEYYGAYSESTVWDGSGKIEWQLNNKKMKTVRSEDGVPFRLPTYSKFVQPQQKADLVVEWATRKINL